MVCLVLAALAAVWVARAVRPPAPLEQGSRTVEIPATSGVLGIARQLAEQGVIRSQAVFVGLTLLRGTARSLKAGEYEVPQGAPAPGRPAASRDGPRQAAPAGAARGLHDPGPRPADRGRGHRAGGGRHPRRHQRAHGLEPRDRVRFARGVPLPRHLPGHQGHARGGDPRADGPALPGAGGHGGRGRARPAARHEPPPARHPGLDRGEGGGAGRGAAHHRRRLPQPAPARHAAPGRSDRLLRPGQGGTAAHARGSPGRSTRSTPTRTAACRRGRSATRAGPPSTRSSSRPTCPTSTSWPSTTGRITSRRLSRSTTRR